jgi:hypothetical protein
MEVLLLVDILVIMATLVVASAMTSINNVLKWAVAIATVAMFVLFARIGWLLFVVGI